MIKGMFLFLISLYRNLISPLKPRVCRFHPSCSEYSFKAIEEHGVMRGFILSIWRVLRCNPFSEGGYDPVPVKGEGDG